MFRRGRFWHCGRIYSDEGFFVSTGGRDAIAYCEGGRKMTITVQEGNGIYEETLGGGTTIPCKDWAKNPGSGSRITSDVRLSRRASRSISWSASSET